MNVSSINMREITLKKCQIYWSGMKNRELVWWPPKLRLISQKSHKDKAN